MIQREPISAIVAEHRQVLDGRLAAHRELALLAAVPFNLMRSVVLVGGRYALGCSAGLMLRMLLIGKPALATVRWSRVLAVSVTALGVLSATTA